MPKLISDKSGFTLIELLVVMAILGIITTLSFGNFRVSQMKSRDAERKADLGQVQRALEMYFNDKNRYPSSLDLTQDNSGLIDENETVYMKELPTDPVGNPEYCYQTNEVGTSYQIYAKLENSQDPDLGGPYTCSGSSAYNYGVASSNENP